MGAKMVRRVKTAGAENRCGWGIAKSIIAIKQGCLLAPYSSGGCYGREIISMVRNGRADKWAKFVKLVNNGKLVKRYKQQGRKIDKEGNGGPGAPL